MRLTLSPTKGFRTLLNTLRIFISTARKRQTHGKRICVRRMCCMGGLRESRRNSMIGNEMQCLEISQASRLTLSWRKAATSPGRSTLLSSMLWTMEFLTVLSTIKVNRELVQSAKVSEWNLAHIRSWACWAPKGWSNVATEMSHKPFLGFLKFCFEPRGSPFMLLESEHLGWRKV